MKEFLYMTSLALITIISIFHFTSCFSNKKYSKQDHLFTDSIGNQLYAESYRIESYGVGGDVYSMYITDSLSFRKFISLYYDNEHFEFKVNSSEILAIKKEDTRGINNPKPLKRIVQEYRFVINDLKDKGEFD